MLDLICSIGIGYQDISHLEISAYRQTLNTEIGKNPLIESGCNIDDSSLPLRLQLRFKNSFGHTKYNGYLMNGTPHTSTSKSNFSEVMLTPILELPLGFDIRHQISIGKWRRDLNDYEEVYSTQKNASGIGWNSQFKNIYDIDLFLGQGKAKTKLTVDMFNFDTVLNEGKKFRTLNFRLGYQTYWLGFNYETWGTSRTKQGIMAAPETKSKRTNVLIGKHWLF